MSVIQRVAPTASPAGRGRTPGRMAIEPATPGAGVTSFGSAAELASALRRAEAAHGEHEARTGRRDANWPEWYAAYLTAEQSGDPSPS